MPAVAGPKSLSFVVVVPMANEQTVLVPEEADYLAFRSLVVGLAVAAVVVGKVVFAKQV